MSVLDLELFAVLVMLSLFAFLLGSRSSLGLNFPLPVAPFRHLDNQKDRLIENPYVMRFLTLIPGINLVYLPANFRL
jgi:hypothetical protein